MELIFNSMDMMEKVVDHRINKIKEINIELKKLIEK